MKTSLLAILCLALGTLSAQTAPTEDVAAMATGSVVGVVMNARGPVPGAQVGIMTPRGLMMTTCDRRGQFGFRVVPEGRGWIGARDGNGHSVRQRLDVQAGQIKRVRLVLR